MPDEQPAMTESGPVGATVVTVALRRGAVPARAGALAGHPGKGPRSRARAWLAACASPWTKRMTSSASDSASGPS